MEAIMATTSQRWIADLYIAALTIGERIALHASHPEWFFPGDREASILLRWDELLGGDGSGAHLDKRLKWDGIDLNTTRAALGCVRLPEDATLPDWCTTVESVAGRPPMPTDRRAQIQTAPDLPFVAVWLNWLLEAQSIVQASWEPWKNLGESLRGAWVLRLLQNLNVLGHDVLASGFAASCQASLEPNEHYLAGYAETPSSHRYEAWIESILVNGGRDFMLEYPALTRIVAERTRLWAEHVIEFHQRLEADGPALAESFNGGSPLGAIKHLSPYLGDSHSRGRAVVVAGFEHGPQIVYKPRDMRCEGAWFDLLQWCNGMLPELRAPEVLAKEGYGWMEFIEQAPCASPADEEAHARRYGMLLCLIRLLHGSDCHHENVIAAGSHPVFIDIETLLSPVTLPH